MDYDKLVEAYFYIRSMMWNEQIWQITQEAQERLIAMMHTMERDLRKEIQDQVRRFGHADEWTIAMEEDVREWLTQTLAGATAATTNFVASVSAGTALATIDEYNSILSFSGKAKNVRLLEGLTRDQLEQIYTRQPLGGSLLSEWVEGTFEKRVKDSLLDAFRAGMEAGEGYKDIVDRAMEAMDVGFIGTRRDVSMLARTYIQSANVGAQEAVFKENEDVIKGYTRLETLDNRTCPQCAFADGLYYAKDEPRPALPIHPCCRGLYIPKTVSFRELGLDLDELEDVARPWTIREDGPIGEGGMPIIDVGRTKGTFQEWWESLSDEEKAKTGIGVTRTALLNDGKLQWRDMVDKRTGRLITLEELGFARPHYARPSSGALAGFVPIQPVRDFDELAQSIKDRCSGLAGRFGITEVVAEQGKDWFMSSNATGKLRINDKTFTELNGFNPLRDLQSAWNKIAAGSKLNFNEEYAVENLWHELIHTKQKPWIMASSETLDKKKHNIMEMLTQWTSRRTYSKLMKKLGGTTEFQQDIIERGYGYKKWIWNFDNLLERLGVKDTDIITKIQKIMLKNNPKDYRNEIIIMLQQQTGRDMKIIERAVNNLDEIYFLSALYSLGLGK